jgi:hypothetical protein
MARFVKGAKRPPKAGRKRGSINKRSALLREAALLAAELEGDQDLRTKAPLNHEPDEEIAKRGGLVGYLRWAARNQPAPYLGFLGRVMPTQIRVDAGEDKTDRTVAEIRREMAARGFAVADLAPLLIEANPVEECKDDPVEECKDDQKDDSDAT